VDLHEHQLHQECRRQGPRARPARSGGRVDRGAADQLWAVELVIPSRATGVCSVFPLVRAAFECLAEVHWLLDPDLSPDDRLGRLNNIRLISLRGTQQLVTKVQIPREQVASDPWEREDDLVERLERMGCGIRKNSRGHRYVEPPRPSTTKLVDGLVVDGFYSYLSGMSHGELWGPQHHLRALEEIPDPSGGGRVIVQFQISAEEYRLLCDRIISGFGESADRVIDYLGWDPSKFRRAMEQAAHDVSH